MLTKAQLHTLRTVIMPQREPVLSLYLDVNPAKSDNAQGAPIIRVKDELKRLSLPKAWSEALLEKLRPARATSRAHTLVVFAGEDLDAFFHSYLLHLSLPDLSEMGVLARWGKPFALPLLHLIDDQERYGVVHLDQARFRYFEVYFDEIEELQDAFRPLDPSRWRRLSEAKVSAPPGIPARGGAGKDKFARRKEAWTHRFYKEAAQLLTRAVKASGVHHLFLLGAPHHVSEFRSVLDASLNEKIAECLPPPANPDASGNDILALIRPCIATVKEARAQALLDDLNERGVQGVGATLEALQEGRLDTVVAAWQLDKTVYLCCESGYVCATLSGISHQCPNEQHRLERLQDVLPELAERQGAHLTYLQGDTGARLAHDFGGLCGLKRW